MVVADRHCSGPSVMLRSQSMNWDTDTDTQTHRFSASCSALKTWTIAFQIKRVYIQHTYLVCLAAPGLFVQKQSQAVGHSQQALRQGVLSEWLLTVKTVLYCFGLWVGLPWGPLGPYAEKEGHEVVTPGNYSSSKNLKKEVCGLQKKKKKKIYIQLVRI